MRRLPLFPLPTVLFPRALMPLHIFEPRYRSMVTRCLERDRTFGLVFHDPDRSGPFLMEEGRVGCVAEIERVRFLEDGRALILTRGRERFRICDGIESRTPYYEGLVDGFEDDLVVSSALVERRLRSIELFRAVLDELPDFDGPHADLDARGEVSFRLAASIQADPGWLQGLLEMQDEAARLDRVDRALQSALERLDTPTEG